MLNVVTATYLFNIASRVKTNNFSISSMTETQNSPTHKGSFSAVRSHHYKLQKSYAEAL